MNNNSNKILKNYKTNFNFEKDNKLNVEKSIILQKYVLKNINSFVELSTSNVMNLKNNSISKNKFYLSKSFVKNLFFVTFFEDFNYPLK